MNHNPHTDWRSALPYKHQFVLTQESRSRLPVEASTLSVEPIGSACRSPFTSRWPLVAPTGSSILPSSSIETVCTIRVQDTDSGPQQSAMMTTKAD
jgi:hypothetical protein